MDEYCEGCGELLASGGPVGAYCPNTNCNYEIEQAISFMKFFKEKKEREELARLKAKYEEGL